MQHSSSKAEGFAEHGPDIAVLLQGHDAGGSLTPSSAVTSAAALERAWFGTCPAGAPHAAAAAPPCAQQQPGEGPAAKRARVLLGEAGQQGLPIGPAEQVCCTLNTSLQCGLHAAERWLWSFT